MKETNYERKRRHYDAPQKSTWKKCGARSAVRAADLREARFLDRQLSPDGCPDYFRIADKPRVIARRSNRNAKNGHFYG